MAQFVATIDASAERRKQFLVQAQRTLSAYYGSAARVFECGEFALASWTSNHEPFRCSETAEGVSCIWGQAFATRSSEQTLDLPKHWRAMPDQLPPALEGIHSALVFRSDGALTVGADLLGVMPVYHYRGDGYFIVGSSPELFLAHLNFRPKLDLEGLAGILLANGLIDGRCLYQDVRRLAAGHLLHTRRDAAPRELSQYAIEVSDRYFGASFDTNARRIEEVLLDCFDRHLQPNQHYGLILSGGLDSRTVAGILKQRNTPFTAFSLGVASDIEMKCAVAVAKALRADHRVVPLNMHHYPKYAADECRWRHLVNGFNTLMFHEPIPDARSCDGMLSGFALDHLIGTTGSGWAGSDPQQMSFENFFKQLNRWGIEPQNLKQLLAPCGADDIVDATVSRLKQNYTHGIAHNFQTSWLAGIRQRLRYHTSAVVGLNSHWPWPIVPFIDKKLLDLMGGMPYEHVRERRMQYHFLKTRFPKIARQPLDRNSFNMRPLVSPYGRIVNHLLYKPSELFYRWASKKRERRFYYRSMDFNSPGWNAVRAAAEPHRSKVLDIFHRATLDELLPTPGNRVLVRDGIIDTSKSKLLAGFMLWSADHL